MRVYLDNCCYNRPYDDQSHVRISLEAQATDDRFLKHSSPRLTILDPIEFVKRLEATP